jgi:hypothetical protein
MKTHCLTIKIRAKKPKTIRNCEGWANIPYPQNHWHDLPNAGLALRGADVNVLRRLLESRRRNE